MSSLAAVLTREIVHPLTGEILDLAQASTEELAAAITALSEDRSRVADFQAAIEATLLEHLDRAAEWTMRVGDPQRLQYEITAPSPQAGTEVYPADKLVPTLQTLLGAGSVTAGAASKACKRQLTLTVDVPWDADLEEMASTLKAAVRVTIAGVPVEVVKAGPYVKPVAQGIAALRKLPGVVEYIDRVKVTQAPPARRVKVSVKGAA